MRGNPVHLRALGLRTRVVLTTLALAAAAWLVAGPPHAANAAKSNSPIHLLHPSITVLEHAVTDTVVHSGGSGDVTGNLLTWHNKVYNPADTKQVGTDQGSCVRIDPAEGSWECSWTTFLAKGQITVQGPYYDTKNSVLAITGGTGAYTTARGDMSLISHKGGTEYFFVFHLG